MILLKVRIRLKVIPSCLRDSVKLQVIKVKKCIAAYLCTPESRRSKDCT